MTSSCFIYFLLPERGEGGEAGERFRLEGYYTEFVVQPSSAMASVASFFTPIGHHGNLLIYGPGRYQFFDFLRVGTPLTLLVAIIVTWMTVLLL